MKQRGGTLRRLALRSPPHTLTLLAATLPPPPSPPRSPILQRDPPHYGVTAVEA